MSKELTNVLKKKFIQFLNEDYSPNTAKGKNASWTKYRSTPYPKSKKLKRSNSTLCKTLSFDDSDSEDSSVKENTFKTTENIKHERKPKTQGTKRKRLSDYWEVTSCDVIRPDKTNQQCNVKNTRVDFTDSSDETLVPDILENDVTSETESSCTDSEAEKKIFKLRLSNTNKCKIIEPDTDTLNTSDQIKTAKNLDNNIDESTLNQEVTTEEQSNESLENGEQINKKLRFGKLVRFFMGEDFCILFLKHPLKLYFNGKLSITVLFGSVEILGSVQDNKKQITLDVYSPRGQSFLCLETVENGLDAKDTLQNILTPYNIPNKQLKEFLYNLGKDDCVLLVKNINNNLTNYLSLHVAQYLYPKPMHCEKTIEKKLHCLFELEENYWKVFRKDELFRCCATITERRREPSSIMICGGKSVGKSTLFRYMTNYFLDKVEKVVCIDLDIGQAEFTIGGCISVTVVDKPLLGPNFTHLQTPVKSFFIGDVNVTNCIDRYIISVQELIHFCEKNVTKEYPWIINYMGFCKSLGCDLTTAVIKIIRPTEVVQISSSVRNKNYPIFLTKENVENYIYSFPIIAPQVKLNYNLLTLNSATDAKIEGDFQFEARSLREMSIISYFSQIIEDGKEITSIPPFSIKLSAIKLHDLNYSRENILAVMNGNLVALCKTKTEEINKETLFECFGFGIIRGIDKDSQELYLLTPVNEEDLNNVNSLIRGNINLPPSLHMTKGRQGLVPYILLGNQRGTNKIPKRSYMNLKDLLKKK